jgi:hypothetical protein
MSRDAGEWTLAEPAAKFTNERSILRKFESQLRFSEMS